MNFAAIINWMQLNKYIGRRGINGVTDDIKSVPEKVTKVKNTANTTFDFVDWLRNNWQLAVLGAIALIVLIKE